MVLFLNRNDLRQKKWIYKPSSIWVTSYRKKKKKHQVCFLPIMWCVFIYKSFLFSIITISSLIPLVHGHSISCTAILSICFGLSLFQSCNLLKTYLRSIVYCLWERLPVLIWNHLWKQYQMLLFLLLWDISVGFNPALPAVDKPDTIYILSLYQYLPQVKLKLILRLFQIVVWNAEQR